MSIRYGDPAHPWPCPVSVGHSTCLCDQEPGTLAADLGEFRQAVVDALHLEDVVAWLQAFLVQPGRHRGARQPVSDTTRAAAVAVVLAAYLVLVGVLS
jgi:hypothetical protein